VNLSTWRNSRSRNIKLTTNYTELFPASKQIGYSYRLRGELFICGVRGIRRHIIGSTFFDQNIVHDVIVLRQSINIGLLDFYGPIPKVVDSQEIQPPHDVVPANLKYIYYT
jgi:hypothetical protein